MPPPLTGATVSAPDGLTFGDSFELTYTEPDNFTGVMGAWVFCSQNGAQVYGSKKTLPGTFTLGPTPKWSGGYASCRVELRATPEKGKPSTVATTTFEVGA